ncbi:MAG: hypothetical protein WEB93_01820, partial [Sphingomonadales bacterium]
MSRRPVDFAFTPAVTLSGTGAIDVQSACASGAIADKAVLHRTPGNGRGRMSDPAPGLRGG